MTKPASKPTNWKDRLRSEVRRDKKKTAILAILLMVAGIFGGRLVITANLPINANAEDTSIDDPADTFDEPIVEQLLPRPWTSAGSPADQARREEYLAQMDRTISRDIFKPDLRCFPPLPGNRGDELEPGTLGWLGTTYRRVIQKQLMEGEELARERAICNRARLLGLQSTMLGSSPTALINGHVLRQGDYVNGFLLKSIASNRCVVSKDGVDVELRMD